MNSLTSFAVVSAALFVLVSQGGEAADVTLQDVVQFAKSQLETADPSLSTVVAESTKSELKLYLINTSRHIGGRVSCVPTLTRQDYDVIPGIGAYKIHKRRMTWNEARKVCLAEGGQLALVDSEQKDKLFKQWRTEKGLSGLWIGFHDLFEEGTWVTVTGESVDTMNYHPWTNGEPNNARTGQHCGILWHNGVDDYECNMQEPFLCEINLCETIGPFIPEINSTSVLA